MRLFLKIKNWLSEGSLDRGRNWGIEGCRVTVVEGLTDKIGRPLTQIIVRVNRDQSPPWVAVAKKTAAETVTIDVYQLKSIPKRQRSQTMPLEESGGGGAESVGFRHVTETGTPERPE